MRKLFQGSFIQRDVHLSLVAWPRIIHFFELFEIPTKRECHVRQITAVWQRFKEKVKLRLTYSCTSSFVLFVNSTPTSPRKCLLTCILKAEKYDVFTFNCGIHRARCLSYLTNLVQIVFIFACFSFTKGNHHDFIFAKEESEEEESPTKELMSALMTHQRF